MSRKPERILRCGIYTRKSTEEGLQQEFNSLDAQRESGEAYIASQQHEGWVCLPEHYDDGGFTGGNMDRPALQRLLADIEARRVDVVLVYKVDRLSRSLLDFGRLMEVFDKHHVSFVSVTQAFNTSNSMGRLMLNVLLSFAQFEREIISERTRDKIAATRRKGKWSGGRPILGYDVDPHGPKLVVNETEALRVRQIFELYLERQSLLATVQELETRGWRTKRWATKKGVDQGGRQFDKNGLYQLLTNVLYAGKVRYKDEIHPGQHPAIVSPELFERVQALLRLNHRSGGAEVRNRYGALLKGLLRCAGCDAAMIHSHSSKDGKKRYRYYVCNKAQKTGSRTCPSKSVPAPEIERFVVEQIRSIGRDSTLVAETLNQTREHLREEWERLEAERRGIERDLARDFAEERQLAVNAPSESARARLADLQERSRLAHERLAAIRVALDGIERQRVNPDEAAQVLGQFDQVWDSLSSHERARVLHLLIERVEYDGNEGEISITFHATGIETLGRELPSGEEDAV